MSTLVDQQKRRQLLTMLDRGLVMVHLDPRREGVGVPDRFACDPVLRLNVAWAFNLPALDIGAEGVYAVLSFNRRNFGCTMPWSSIFAMTHPDQGHLGMLWPESVPPELRPYFDQVDRGTGAVAVTLEPQGAVRHRDPDEDTEPAMPRRASVGGLRLIEGGLDEAVSVAAAMASRDAEPAGRSHLRVIK